jgi:hypothetical protein
MMKVPQGHTVASSVYMSLSDDRNIHSIEMSVT